MASSSIFPFVKFVGFVAFVSDAKAAKDEELFGPSERRGRFAIVLLGGGVFDITRGGSFRHKKPTIDSHTRDVFERRRMREEK